MDCPCDYSCEFDACECEAECECAVDQDCDCDCCSSEASDPSTGSDHEQEGSSLKVWNFSDDSKLLELYSSGATDDEMAQALNTSSNKVSLRLIYLCFEAKDIPFQVTRGNQTGKRWTDDEEAKLREAFEFGLSLTSIAITHERSSSAIAARLVSMRLAEPVDLSTVDYSREIRSWAAWSEHEAQLLQDGILEGLGIEILARQLKRSLASTIFKLVEMDWISTDELDSLLESKRAEVRIKRLDDIMRSSQLTEAEELINVEVSGLNPDFQFFRASPDEEATNQSANLAQCYDQYAYDVWVITALGRATSSSHPSVDEETLVLSETARNEKLRADLTELSSQVYGVDLTYLNDGEVVGGYLVVTHSRDESDSLYMELVHIAQKYGQPAIWRFLANKQLLIPILNSAASADRGYKLSLSSSNVF